MDNSIEIKETHCLLNSNFQILKTSNSGKVPKLAFCCYSDISMIGKHEGSRFLKCAHTQTQ